MEAHNRGGVRYGDMLRALMANLHVDVRPDELADMPPEHVTVVGAVRSVGYDHIDCLLRYTHLHEVEPGHNMSELCLWMSYQFAKVLSSTSLPFFPFIHLWFLSLSLSILLHLRRYL